MNKTCRALLCLFMYLHYEQTDNRQTTDNDGQEFLNTRGVLHFIPANTLLTASVLPLMSSSQPVTKTPTGSRQGEKLHLSKVSLCLCRDPSCCVTQWQSIQGGDSNTIMCPDNKMLFECYLWISTWFDYLCPGRRWMHLISPSLDIQAFRW